MHSSTHLLLNPFGERTGCHGTIECRLGHGSGDSSGVVSICLTVLCLAARYENRSFLRRRMILFGWVVKRISLRLISSLPGACSGQGWLSLPPYSRYRNVSTSFYTSPNAFLSAFSPNCRQTVDRKGALSVWLIVFCLVGSG